MSEEHMIRVWPFYRAPEHLRALSQHGGDEDWLALVPLSVETPEWLTSTGYFGFGGCSVSEREMADGSRVYIGVHA